MCVCVCVCVCARVRVCVRARALLGIIYCTEPGLKEALYILYVHVSYVYNTKI
jgi:hypothetical protein